MLTDIVKIIVEKCVHPVTKRRFTPETIKTAIKDSHFPIKHDQPAKRQALLCIKMLQTRYKIARGEMKIRITFEKETEQDLTQALKTLEIEEFEQEEDKGSKLERLYNIEPKLYHLLTPLCKKLGSVTIEVIVGVMVNEENKGLESEQFSALELQDEFKGAGQEQEKEKEEGKI